jgi:tRNA A37 threonylcarbamoyladenosine biosynthesis protein TsaE
MAIEWAERLPREPAPPSIRVTLAHQPAGRTITIDL